MLIKKNVLLIIYSQILSIYCVTFCNKVTNLSPTIEQHCSGLKISQYSNPDDKYCCLWQYVDESQNQTVTRCSSISESQYNNLTSYIKRKRSTYKDLIIKCTEDQKLYCSNVVLDEDIIEDCRALKISIDGDKYCCRWNYKDSTNHDKNNNYCASINEYEYLTIKDYIRYKTTHPLQRYDELTINCISRFIKISLTLFLLFIII